jgi:serine palmitoyltransferase
MGIAMKDRLRRLLMSGSNKFRKESDHEQHQARGKAHGGVFGGAGVNDERTYMTTDTCSTSHETTDSNSECGGGGDNDGAVAAASHYSHYSSSFYYYGNNASYCTGVDPYADVRERLEALSLANRKRNGIVPYDDHDDELLRHASSSFSIESSHDAEEETLNVPAVDAYLVYLSYAMLITLGKFYDTVGTLWYLWQALLSWPLGWWYSRGSGPAAPGPVTASHDPDCYAPLLKSWENFYTRHLYARVQDAFNRPIGSNPGAMISVLERGSTNHMKTMRVIGKLAEENKTVVDGDRLSAEYERGPHFTTVPHNGVAARRCLNLGSYNYLGFADDWQNTCASAVTYCVSEDFAPSTSSSRGEFGTTVLHEQLERIVADFCGKDDAIVLNMGFNVNASVIPTLMTHGDLILSDELNHTSIVAGARASGAAIRVFGHNDTKSLNHALREAVVMGRPRTRRPWNRIWVLVEGIYSMEGEYCNLRSIVQLCKQYGAYIYLDEAHSIGSMGATGRGVTEYCGVDTADIDIMMGTFTKSFGGMGGYITAQQSIIDVLRERCAASVHHNALPPIVCQQVITAFQVRSFLLCFFFHYNFLTIIKRDCTFIEQIIMGQDGTNLGRQKLQALRDNSNYFRMRLQEIGLHVLGQYDSPVLPVMLFEPGKIMNFTRECYKRGLAVVRGYWF